MIRPHILVQMLLLSELLQPISLFECGGHCLLSIAAALLAEVPAVIRWCSVLRDMLYSTHSRELLELHRHKPSGIGPSMLCAIVDTIPPDQARSWAVCVPIAHKQHGGLNMWFAVRRSLSL